MAKANDLKALQMKQKDLDSQKLMLVRKMAEVQQELNKVHKNYDVISKQIDQLTKDFTVTEHALLRYCERIYNIDLNEMSKKIIESESLKKYDLLGNGEYPLRDGLKMLIRDKIIVTIK
jgi:uncharacterized protein YeaC (DUF1315 family)